MSYCPNCFGELESAQVQQCWNCNARFLPPSVWRPVAERSGEFVPIPRNQPKPPDFERTIYEPDVSALFAATLVCALAFVQFALLGINAMSCRGGCPHFFLSPLLFAGLAGVYGLSWMRHAMRHLGSANVFSDLLACALLIPGLISILTVVLSVISILGELSFLVSYTFR
jgi:hypothetical protein